MNINGIWNSNCLITLNKLIRHYAFKSDLKIKWIRPEKIPSIHPIKSGDCSGLASVNPKELLRYYRDSKELETADAIVRSMYELGNNYRYHTSDYYRDNIVKAVQRHTFDFDSMEVKLAKMTVNIRRYQDLLQQHPRDVKRKVFLKELIDKRKKYLKYLRRWDYRRFEWLIEKLDLVYKPHPPEYHWITRKESLQKLTNIHCDKLRQQKLDEYRKILEDEQIPFLEKAIQNMEFIRQEQIDLDIPITVTQEHIDEYKKRLTELKEARKRNAQANEEQMKKRNFSHTA